MESDLIRSWQETVRLLRLEIERVFQVEPAARGWAVLLEFRIPRRGRRPDVILIAHNIIFIVECKIGARSFDAGGVWQVRRYSLDLRDFHQASAKDTGRHLVPILWATGCDRESRETGGVTLVGRTGLAASLLKTYKRLSDPSSKAIDAEEWERAAYRPTPSIIEAASTLYANHNVADISHSFATNLSTTTEVLVDVVNESRTNGNHAICFVTGIPGAGKTLTGLSAVHDPSIRYGDSPAAIFLSGNGPLVKIVREALTRDEVSRGARRQVAAHRVSTFIDNVHRFLVEYGLDDDTTDSSYEQVVVFDEAQRAWDASQVYRKHKVQKSEPEMILEIMERKPDWAVVIALVGGGQEINSGEAGLEEWGRALNARTTNWSVFASPEVLNNGVSVAGHQLFPEPPRSHLEVVEYEALNLTVNTRSHRAQRLGGWVNAIVRDGSLIGQTSQAESIDIFPITLTRHIETARAWLRDRADPMERFGLLASSGALRLRPYGIEVSSGFRKGYPFTHWFLNPRDDVLSSHQLEVAATEFECQGLELDWACVCWGGDFTIDAKRPSAWQFRAFKGSRWCAIRKAKTQEFIRNKYRVLLTRARQGMIIWVPDGDASDETRDSSAFDAVAKRLIDAGVENID